VINPHDFFYQESSKANVKTMTDTKVMQIEGKAILDLLEKYPEFKKRWLKSVFPYSIKLTQAHEFLDKEFNSRQQRRFIEGSIVVFLTAGQLLNIDFGAYVFEGQVYSDGGTYIRGQFISQNKTIKAETNAKIMQFQNIAGIKFETQRISAVNRDI
jgi:CRP-like cAMP-binding protein